MCTGVTRSATGRAVVRSHVRGCVRHTARLDSDRPAGQAGHVTIVARLPGPARLEGVPLRKLAHVTLALVCATAGSAVAASPAAAATPIDLVIYVDAAASAARGAAGRDGATRSSAVASVAQAQDIARQKKARNVTINLAPGEYQPFEWTYAPKGGQIIVAGENAAARTAAVSAMATFTCNGGDGYAITVSGANFTLSDADVTRCNDGGILITDAGAVRLTNNYYHHIGANWADGTGNGFAAVHIKNTDDVEVWSSEFYAVNSTTGGGNVHGVYIANDSDRVDIFNNDFGFVSGDPVRFRNQSDYGVVDNNRFWSTGYVAIVSDWRFDGEACSVGNVAKNNTIGRWTFDGHEYNVDPLANGVVPSYRKWGHDTVKPGNLGGCSPDPVVFGGGSSWTGSDPRS